MVGDPDECLVPGALLFVDGGMTALRAVCEAGRRVSDRHWPAPRRLSHTLATSPTSQTQPRYEGHSALGCCTGLPWRSMLMPTSTAGTAQTIQLAL
jgi:hypothetical protein